MEQPALSPLFDAFELENKTLKNRFLVAPMSRVSALESGVPDEEMDTYYTNFAKGGFGGIITEGTYTDELLSKSYAYQPGIANEQEARGWQKIVTHVHEYKTVIICQLMHGGAISQWLEQTIAPSAVTPVGKKMPAYGGAGAFDIPQEMTQADIDEAVKGFALSAKRAFQAGFDGVEIHAANGYLLDQFLTDYTNLRTDRYGGSVENQLRITAEIFSAIRSVCPSMILGLRLSEGKVNDLRYRWAEGADRARQLLKEVKKIRPSYVHIASERGNWQEDIMYKDGSSFTGLAREIVGVPVLANGGLHNTPLAEKLIEQKHADLITVGKAALADPSWPNKIKNGEVPIPFHHEMIKEKATIENTNKWLEKA